MQVIIDIPEDVYRRLKAGDTNAGNTFHNTALESIGNGVVLPESHGDLIDRSELIKVLETEIMYTEDTKRLATLNYILCVIAVSTKAVIKAD